MTAVERIPPRSFAQATSEGANESVNDDGNARTGVVKVRLESLEQKKRCLRNKARLKGNSDFPNVCVRNCEDHASRLNRLNMDTLLRKLGRKDQFYFTGSGRLVEKDQHRTATDRQGGGDEAHENADAQGPATRSSARGGSRGQGRGTGQRGGSRGRGNPTRGARGGQR